MPKLPTIAEPLPRRDAGQITMTEFATAAFIFGAGFSGITTGVRYLTLPVICVILALLMYTMFYLTIGRFRLRMVASDMPLLGLLGWICFSYVYQPTPGGQMYVVAYAFVFLVQYLAMRTGCMAFGNAAFLMRANMWTVAMVSTAALIEFIFENFLHVPIWTYIDPLRIVPSRASTTVYALGRVKRSFAFSNEPTNLANYLGTLGPVACWTFMAHYRKLRFKSWGFIALVAAAMLTTQSTAGLLGIILSGALGSLLLGVTTPRHHLFILFLALVLGGAGIFMSVQISSRFFSMFSKLDNYEAIYRYQSMSLAFEEIANHSMFGTGLRTHQPPRGADKDDPESKRNIISWYLLLAAETGIPSVILLFTFYFFVINDMLAHRIPGQLAFIIGLLECIIHWATTAVFFEPTLWALLILYYVYARSFSKATAIQSKANATSNAQTGNNATATCTPVL